MQPAEPLPPPARPARPGRLGRGLLAAVLLVFVLAAAGAGWLAVYAFSPGPGAASPQATVFIPRGTSVARIGELLGDQGLIRTDPRFVLLARLLGVSAILPAGEFLLATRQTPVDLLRQLAAAEPVQHRVTVVEGLRLEEIAALFAAGGWVDRDRFLALARDPGFIEELGLGPAASLEGYLFPDTYRLTRPSPGERQLLTRLVNRSLEVWRTLEQGENRLGRHEAFTLAAMVEKETGSGPERPLIASVFLNRLRRSMKLQSDPTVIYGIDDFTGPLRRSDLNTVHPYNTYLIDGLPPGPICSPGRDSLQAVLTPADSGFLYFVSKNDGTHQFSTTLAEHNRAVRLYRR